MGLLWSSLKEKIVGKENTKNTKGIYVENVEEIAGKCSRICQSARRLSKIELERRAKELHPALSKIATNHASIDWPTVRRFERHVSLSERTGRSMSKQRMMEEPWDAFQVLVEGRCMVHERPGFGCIGFLVPRPCLSRPGTGCISADLSISSDSNDNNSNDYIWSLALPQSLVDGFDTNEFLPALPVANRISSFLENQLRIHVVLRHVPSGKMATIIDYDETPVKITWRPPDQDIFAGPTVNALFDSAYWHCPGGSARAAQLKSTFRFMDISKQYPHYPIRVILSNITFSIGDSNDERRLACITSAHSVDWQHDIKRHLFCPYLRWA